MCTVERRGQIFILTLAGDVENRLSHELISSLRSSLSQIRSQALSSPLPSVLVTTAAGNKFFSNGFDLAYANAAPTSADRAARLNSMVTALIPVVAELISLPMPTIAAVTGHAAAAGLMLALSHDYIVMRGDRGVLYLPEMDLRLPFPPYFLSIMREKVRDLRASKDLVMKSRKIGAEEALERGVVDVVRGSPEETVAAAVEMAEGFLKRKWDGTVYASIRKASFPEISGAVGLKEETDQERRQITVSRL